MAFTPEAGTFYTIEDLETAGIAGRFAIRRWIKTKRLKAAKVGRVYMIRGEDIRDFMTNGSGALTGGAKKGAKTTAERRLKPERTPKEKTKK